MARRRTEQQINKIVAYLPGVVEAVHEAATKIAIVAEVRLSMHRDTGAAYVEVTRGRKTDSFVSLVDPAAKSIEFGHWHNRSGEWVDGLYIVTGAAKLF